MYKSYFKHHSALDFKKGQFCVSPELSQVVVPRLTIRGSRDANGEAWLELPELQQNNGQVVDEEQRIHQGHGVLHNALVVLVLKMMQDPINGIYAEH